jgi:hypothetical protein
MVKVRWDLWNRNKKPLVRMTEEEKLWDKKLKKFTIVAPSANLKHETIRYWMVDVTLTSGKVQSFYVKAKTKFDALNKAEELKFLTLIPKLQTDKLVLRD